MPVNRAERAERLQAVLSMPGWQDVIAMADELAKDSEDYVLDLMAHHPEKLTGRTAIARANRAKGIRTLIGEIEDEAKISRQPSG